MYVRGNGVIRSLSELACQLSTKEISLNRRVMSSDSFGMQVAWVYLSAKGIRMREG